MLKFIGVGSAFNTDWGNTSAYTRLGDTLILFDCGSLVFHLLKFEGVLHGIKHVYVIQTHTHTDHIGSLGGLIEWMNYKVEPVGKAKVTIVTPADNYLAISGILKFSGVSRELYDINIIKTDGFSWINIEESISTGIKPVSVKHVNDLACFGYVVLVGTEAIYYSGDSNMIPEYPLELLEKNHLDYFYQDVSSQTHEGKVHLSLDELEQLIAPEYRHKVYCMHRDEEFDIYKAQELGFKVANIEGEWEDNKNEEVL